MSNQVLQNIRTRRVIRHMTNEPVKREQLEQVLEAGRWAPTGGNLRPHRFVVVQNPTTRRLIRMVSPGMFQKAPVLILICINWDVVRQHKVPEHDRSFYIDVGTAAQTMMLAAHALGLASGPVTSFSQAAVRVILNLPESFSPEMFICIGHAAKVDQTGMRAWKKITWQDLTYWERFP
ncbi:MAG: nitroreductase family protein [Chloroflexi bacterium]|nr:MAG: nitroreductase family protein [Phototrophicales bacterium]RMF79239.1 MAG: nitroreductase family protein [Chloroflexota bacterium]